MFPNGSPTSADLNLARDLFEALDPESQAWYGGDAFLARLRQHADKNRTQQYSGHTVPGRKVGADCSISMLVDELEARMATDCGGKR